MCMYRAGSRFRQRSFLECNNHSNCNNQSNCNNHSNWNNNSGCNNHSWYPSKVPAEVNKLVAVVGRGGAGDIHGVSLVGRKTFFMLFMLCYVMFNMQATSMVFPLAEKNFLLPFVFGFLCCGSHNRGILRVSRYHTCIIQVSCYHILIIYI